MRFKAGDKVRVKNTVKNGDFCIYNAEEFKGEILTIREVNGGECRVKENDWTWSDDMLEKVTIAPNELEFADILILRNGERYVYADGRMCGEKGNYYCEYDYVYSHYNDNLKSDEDADYDIMKVERAGQVIFEREDVREMTTDEASKKLTELLGHEVKVIGKGI